MENKEYKIETLNDLIDVATPENVDALIKDLSSWLRKNVEIFDEFRKEYPEKTKGLKNSELAKVSFIWVDDGQNDFLGIELTVGN